MVNMSKAILHPMATRSTSNSDWPASKVGVIVNVREQEEEVVVSVLLVIIRRGVIAAGPHSLAAVGLRLKMLCAFTLGRYLHVAARCAEGKLGMTMIT